MGSRHADLTERRKFALRGGEEGFGRGFRMPLSLGGGIHERKAIADLPE